MQGLNGVNGAAALAHGTSVELRLARAAHQFEAMMMKELLTPLSRPDAVFGDDDGGETGVLGEFASESLAGALSASGGFGIAERIVRAMSRPGNSLGTSAAIQRAETNSGMSTDK